MSFSSMVGSLSALSLSRTSTNDERGRPTTLDKRKARSRPSSISAAGDEDYPSPASSIRARSTSPFLFRRRQQPREPSPDAIGALTQSDVESDVESLSSRNRRASSSSAAYGAESEDESGDETEGFYDSDEAQDEFDPLTEENTEKNALIPAPSAGDTEVVDHDPTGEGVNVVVPPEPYFPTTLNGTSARIRRRKSTKVHDPLPMNTSRPAFQRDRCTITIRHGNPTAAIEESGRRPRRYVVASDMSEESRYAVEWGIGTVLRDGDEMLIVHVNENEGKVDPAAPNTADRTLKVRSQQERQAMAYILVRQATALLQRTKLNVTVICQAWHAKNSRHMLLDVVDYVEPSMLIVGSRGLGQLKGILLGSTSHYLIQKCSVPVMVARRRLRKPPKRAAHLSQKRARVSLAEAGIDRVASRVDQDVAHMREEVDHDDERRHVPETLDEEEEDEEADAEEGKKVAGT